MKHNHMKSVLSPENKLLQADGGATAWVASPGSATGLGLCPSGVQEQSPGRGSGGQSLPESGEDFAQLLNWFLELNN